RSMRRGRIIAGASVSMAILAAAASCLEPTEIRVQVVTTDCTGVRSTVITIAGSAAELVGHAPSSEAEGCVAAAGEIGSFRFGPNGGKDAPVAIQVTTGITRPGEDCAMNDNDGCIVALRELRFVPHTPLVVRVRMSKACLGVHCPTKQTCENGVCVDDTVD